MSIPTEGQKAPDFNLKASNGETVSLKGLKGKRVVVYFYPKDDTPGCTVEACSFRDNIKKFETKDTVILGVSPDSVESHNKFIEKFKLPFILLSDPEKKMCQDYGVWMEKSMYGKKYMGVARMTFIIDKNGVIEKVYEKVKPDVHTDEVLEYLSAK
jgi:thioredoxin-dependent peroxiredoxin